MTQRENYAYIKWRWFIKRKIFTRSIKNSITHFRGRKVVVIGTVIEEEYSSLM